jgi:hypothetical protein
MTKPSDHAELALQQKLKSCRDFLSATRLLEEALKNQEMTAVGRLIKRRDELIGTIDGLDRRIGRFLKTAPPAADSAVRGRMTALSKELHQVLKLIESANEACGTLAARKCGAIKNEMIRVRHSRECVQGYAPTKPKRAEQFLNMKT